MDVTVHGGDAGQRASLESKQLKPDWQEVFRDDEKPGRWQQRVDVRDATGDGVLDRDHGELGLSFGDRGERVFERRTG